MKRSVLLFKAVSVPAGVEYFREGWAYAATFMEGQPEGTLKDHRGHSYPVTDAASLVVPVGAQKLPVRLEQSSFGLLSVAAAQAALTILANHNRATAKVAA